MAWGGGTAALSDSSPAAPAFHHTADIIYARPDGTALTMDEFIPRAPANGKIVVAVISSGWFSSHQSIDPAGRGSVIRPLLDHGYKVYAVVHRSSPRFTMEDAVDDVRRAVQFVRHRERQDGHTSVSVGITGASAGGHLSLMMGTTGDDGDSAASDPVSRESSRVQAVACYFPPTDFLNYGEPGLNVMETTAGRLLPAAFDFQQLTPLVPGRGIFSARYDDVTTPSVFNDRLQQMSPRNHATADDAPALLIHGDRDGIVPFQQAEVMRDDLQRAGVECQVLRKPGKDHGWPDMAADHEAIVRWFDEHL